MITLERLNKTNKLEYPTNTLIDYYDIIHKLLEALSISQKIKFSGIGAHKELIYYISKTYNFSSEHSTLLQNLREHRNRISYEGFNIDSKYIKQYETEIIKIIFNLLKLTEQ